jgi:hypothetical protein
MFLNPRQAAILTALVRRISKSLNRTITVCETGFGSGHSLSLFLNAAPNAHVVTFDKFDRPNQLPLWNHLNKTYSQDHKLEYFAGDSCRTVPENLSSHKGVPGKIQCDVIHGSSLCSTDNIDLVENSPCGALLSSTAMSNLDDKSVYFGPRAQWRALRERGCISDPVCFEEGLLEVEGGSVFEKEGSMSKFCIAMTTGRCQKRDGPGSSESSCTTAIHRVISQLHLGKLCPQYQLKAPV